MDEGQDADRLAFGVVPRHELVAQLADPSPEVGQVVPPRGARELIRAAAGARADMYEAGHALDDEATVDRVAWLVERLGMQPVPADVLATVDRPDE